MSSQFIFPKPPTWEEFEDLVCDIMRYKLSCWNLQRYGRSGQKQHGIDIIGNNAQDIFVIQCKHYPNNTLSDGEIDKTLEKLNDLQFKIQRLFIVTSSERDARLQGYILNLNSNGQFAFEIELYFWEDLVTWLGDYPDIAYKYFSRFFQAKQLEEIPYPIKNEVQKNTEIWDGSTPLPDLTKLVPSYFDIRQYSLTIGINSFPNTSLNGDVDIEVNITQLLENQTEDTFRKVAQIFDELKLAIDTHKFAHKLRVVLKTRLPFAYLFGWKFRRITEYEIHFIHHQQIWGTHGLPPTNADLDEDLHIILNDNSKEVAVALSITRDVLPSVESYIRKSHNRSCAIIPFHLEKEVRNSAHALAIAQTIARKIKRLHDKKQIEHIHLFGAIPCPLASLIMYHVNAVCPISIYYLDEGRKNHILAGTITNNL